MRSDRSSNLEELRDIWLGDVSLKLISVLVIFKAMQIGEITEEETIGRREGLVRNRNLRNTAHF